MPKKQCEICNSSDELRICKKCNYVFCQKCMIKDFLFGKDNPSQIRVMPEHHNFCPKCESNDIMLVP
jgi:hypothetical protein